MGESVCKAMYYIEEEGILWIEVNLVKINILEFLVGFLYRVEISACQTFGYLIVVTVLGP